MPTLSVAIITHNEMANLPAWLEAAAPLADEIVAVDSGSTDGTPDFLARAGVKVAHRNWTGYTEQRNYCAGLCTSDWILFLDADERPDRELTQAVQEFKAGPGPRENGLTLTYALMFLGHFMRHGGFYPERKLRLYRRGKGEWKSREVHERLEVEGPLGRLAGNVLHHSYNSVGDYLRRMDRYSEEAARQMHRAGRKAGLGTATGHAAWAVFNRFLLRRGFLDGWHGYLYACLEGIYTFSKYAKLSALARSGEERP